MLFNSYEFIFIFLPVALLGFQLIGKLGRYRVSMAWLISVSLFFYGWWNTAYLGLMIFSILFNYSIGFFLRATFNHRSLKKYILVAGILTNLLVLGYYKYFNFFVNNFNTLNDTHIILNEIILPLAISFFTFQQISYLFDTYKGKVEGCDFLSYCLFVTFFPQLIAGPIVHHKEMMPQFKKILYKLKSKNIAIGLTVFTLGLFKKVVLADGSSEYASPIFDASEAGVLLTFFEAWTGALAYTFQLYFDFSGYSDMAVGTAKMFGINIPVNFNSPYKSTSIIDFWKRWHITLSNFLRDYLYIPLGGNKKGGIRRYVNLMITMVLGGLWHGAGWTFILWGALHGFYLIVNHGWRRLFNGKKNSGSIFGWSITFLVVTMSWVPFRSETINGAINILNGMLGINGISLPANLNKLFPSFFDFNGMFVNGLYENSIMAVTWVLTLLIISLTLPNTQQFVKTNSKKYTESFNSWIYWRATKLYAFAIAIMLVVSISSLNSYSEFLYFQF